MPPVARTDLSPPFQETDELNKQLVLNRGQPGLGLTITRATKKSKSDGVETVPLHLPGQPRMLLGDPHRAAMAETLQLEFLTPMLDKMSPHLWLVATQSSSHISSLHHQIVRARTIVITEKAELHLIWAYDRVYIKPIPKYLLSHAFWSYYLASDASPLTPTERRALWAATAGFMRSYYYLIQHKSDFLLAKKHEHQLLPKGITFAQFCKFTRPFKELMDEDVSDRYHFGELRLTRLNFWSKIFLHQLNFQKNYGQYGPYFARFYGPLLFAFALFTLVLSAMQVELAVQQVNAPGLNQGSWASFSSVSRIFSVFTLVCVIAIAFFLLLLLVFLLMRELCFALKDLYKKRKAKRRAKKEAGANQPVKV